MPVVGSPCHNKVFSDRKNWCDDTDKYPDVTELEINGQSSIPLWGVILAVIGNFFRFAYIWTQSTVLALLSEQEYHSPIVGANTWKNFNHLISRCIVDCSFGSLVGFQDMCKEMEFSAYPGRRAEKG